MKNLKSLVLIFIILLVNPILVRAEYIRKKDDVVPNVYVAKIKSNKEIYDYMYIPQRNSDRQFVYCLEPGVHINEDEEYNDYTYNLPYYANMTSVQINRVKEIISFGYGYKDTITGIDHSDKKWYAATQSLLWDINSNGFEIYFTSYLQGPKINPFEQEREEILNLVNTYSITPNLKIDGDIIAGQQMTLIDQNNVLSGYNVSTDNTNISIISKEGNKLIVEGNTVGKTKITFTKRFTSHNGGFHLYKLDGSQTLISPGNLETVSKSTTINIVGGSAIINKVDYDTNTNKPQGGASLEGAIYIITDSRGRTIDTLTTDQDGRAKSKEVLKINEKYYLREINPSEGYMLDSNVYPINVSENNLHVELYLKEKIITNKVEIRKKIVSENGVVDEIEPNITFDIFLNSNKSLYNSITTNADGIANIVLPYGTYTFIQRNSSNNFDKSENFEISVNNNEEIIKEIKDYFHKIKLKVNKRESESNQIISNMVFRFKIKDLINDTYICPDDIKECYFETNNGILTPNILLDIGKYQVEEMEELNYYFEYNPKPVTFNITSDQEYIDNTLEIDFYNQLKKGTIRVEKFNETYIVNNNEIEYKMESKDNIEFYLLANNDIFDYNGQIIYKKGDLVGTYKTKNGEILIDNLLLGEYRLEEQILDDYISIDPITIILDNKSSSSNLIINNYLKKGTIKIIKIDLLTKERISNTNFIIYSNDIVINGITDCNGEILLSNIPYGRYTIQESEPSENYVLNDYEYYIDLNSDKEYEITVENERIAVPNTFFDISEITPILQRTLYYEEEKFKKRTMVYSIINL